MPYLAPLSPLLDAPPPDRSQPPDHLSESAKLEWQAIVGRMAKGHFGPGSWAALATLCECVVELEAIGREMVKFPAVPRGGKRWERYCALQRIRIKLAGKVGSLSTRLRLTQQQKYDAKTAYWLATKSNGPARRPWDPNRASAFATELIGSQPDVIFCSSTAVTAALHQATSTIPIVFAIVSDPVGSGFVAGLPRPGGNITGLTHIEAATGGKWLSLLKEIAPGIKRAAFMLNPETAPGGGKNFLASFEAAAGSLGIEPVAIPVRSDAEIETAIAALGAEQAG